jgi:hypothetical protein
MEPQRLIGQPGYSRYVSQTRDHLRLPHVTTMIEGYALQTLLKVRESVKLA